MGCNVYLYSFTDYITSSDNADFSKLNCVIAITYNEISHVSQFWIVTVSSIALLFATAYFMYSCEIIILEFK